jgi:hypothetical protein
MKAPAVGTSSEIRRPNSNANKRRRLDRHLRVSIGRNPQMRPMRVHEGYSHKPGRSRCARAE